MPLGIATASIVAGAHQVWSYNRKNYLFDRELRQTQEFKTIGFANENADLWREDVRMIFELTLGKVEQYLLVVEMIMGLCADVYIHGRLEPGTPGWLIRFNLIALTCAFGYFLMALWMGIRAQVVSQAYSTQVLTQFVRLRIPTWRQLEAARTYAASFETLSPQSWFRIPFLQTVKGRRMTTDSSAAGAGASSSNSKNGEAKKKTKMTPDPWGLEQSGAGIAELRPVRHHDLWRLRHAQVAQFTQQYFIVADAVTRVSMFFGALHFLYAVAYNSCAYSTVTLGAPLAAISVLVLMTVIAILLVELDISLTNLEKLRLYTMMVISPACVGFAALLWSKKMEDDTSYVPTVVASFACMGHGLLILYLIQLLDFIEVMWYQKPHESTPTVLILPRKFRMVSYLDVYGAWFRQTCSRVRRRDGSKHPDELYEELRAIEGAVASLLDLNGEQDALAKSELERLEQCSRQLQDIRKRLLDKHVFFTDHKARAKPERHHHHRHHTIMHEPSDPTRRDELSSLEERVEQLRQQTHEELNKTRVQKATQAVKTLGAGTRDLFIRPADQINRAAKRAASSESSLTYPEPLISTTFDCGRPEDIKPDDGGQLQEGPGGAGDILHGTALGTIEDVDEDAFLPTRFLSSKKNLKAAKEKEPEEPVDAGHAKPGEHPWRLFRWMSGWMAVVWLSAACFNLYFLFFPDSTGYILTEMAEEYKEKEEKEKSKKADERLDGLKGLIEKYEVPDRAANASYTGLVGRKLAARWPSRFVPRSITCDARGNAFAVADYFSVWTGLLPPLQKEGERLSAEVNFTLLPPCLALEGQEIIDLVLSCCTSKPEGGFDAPSPSSSSACTALILAARPDPDTGHVELSQCPLRQAGAGGGGGSAVGERASVFSGNGKMWRAPGRWLVEFNDSLSALTASPGSCVGAAGRADNESSSSSSSSSSSAGLNGLVLMSSSAGRLVPLVAPHGSHSVALSAVDAQKFSVMPGSMWQTDQVRNSSLELLSPTQLLSLQARGRLSALSVGSGASVGEWQLPSEIQWLATCHSNGFLYALGLPDQRSRSPPPLEKLPAREKEKAEENRSQAGLKAAPDAPPRRRSAVSRVELWQFPLPEQLAVAEGGLHGIAALRSQHVEEESQPSGSADAMDVGLTEM